MGEAADYACGDMGYNEPPSGDGRLADAYYEEMQEQKARADRLQAERDLAIEALRKIVNNGRPGEAGCYYYNIEKWQIAKQALASLDREVKP